MSRQQPGSVTSATRLLWGLVALSGLTALLTAIMRADLVRVWASGHPDASGSVEPPQFVPVAIVLFVVFAALAGVLVMFFRDGHGWARLALSGLVAFMAVGTLSGLRAQPPALFLVLSWVSVGLDVALLVCLWHKDTSTYIRGAWLASDKDRAGSSSPS